MSSLQRIGGVAALFEAAAFVFGFYVFATLIEPARYGASDVAATTHIAFLAQHRGFLTLWNLVIYVAFGAALVALTLALRARIGGALADAGAAFGLIWAGLVLAAGMVANIGIGVLTDLGARDPAQAAQAWHGYRIVVDGLGGGNEIVGGLWLALTCLAAWRTATLPRWLSGAGIVIGAAGLLTTVPPLRDLGAVFGIGLILWFAAAGVVLLRGHQTPLAA